jgi:hypothetical protein
MSADLAQELLNELGSSLEKLETQHTALLQFLRDQGIVTDDQLAPYLTQAGKASNVRWLGARIRLEHLFSAEKHREEQVAEKEQHKAEVAQAPSQDHGKEAKSKDDKDNGEAERQREAAVTNAAAESTGAQAVSENDSKKEVRATSEDGKTSTK